ncbi:hypothetical protein D3C72_1508280 [compost metagenome]
MRVQAMGMLRSSAKSVCARISWPVPKCTGLRPLTGFFAGPLSLGQQSDGGSDFGSFLPRLLPSSPPFFGGGLSIFWGGLGGFLPTSLSLTLLMVGAVFSPRNLLSIFPPGTLLKTAAWSTVPAAFMTISAAVLSKSGVLSVIM